MVAPLLWSVHENTPGYYLNRILQHNINFSSSLPTSDDGVAIDMLLTSTSNSSLVLDQIKCL
jgi:hypothetical protein